MLPSASDRNQIKPRPWCAAEALRFRPAKPGEATCGQLPRERRSKEDTYRGPEDRRCLDGVDLKLLDRRASDLLVVFSVPGNVMQSEDAVQEAIWRFLKKGGVAAIDAQRGTAMSLLLGILRRVVLEAARAARRHPRSLAVELADSLTQED